MVIKEEREGVRQRADRRTKALVVVATKSGAAVPLGPVSSSTALYLSHSASVPQCTNPIVY